MERAGSRGSGTGGSGGRESPSAYARSNGGMTPSLSRLRSQGSLGTVPIAEEDEDAEDDHDCDDDDDDDDEEAIGWSPFVIQAN